MSVAVAVSSPSFTGTVVVSVQLPSGCTVAVPNAALPGAGPVNAMVAPGSPVPLTVKVPLAFCVTGSVISTTGAVLST